MKVEEFLMLKALIPKDYRIDRNRKTFDLTDQDVVDLFVIHRGLDREGLGDVAVLDFFDKHLGIKSNLLTDSVLKLIDTKKRGMISFGEYVDIVCTYCCFEIGEITKFIFYTLDAEKQGTADKNEIKHFVYDMYDHEVTSNISESLAWLDANDRGDCRFNYDDIWRMHVKYNNLFYPAFRIQIMLIRTTFGEEWWNMKKATLIDTKADRMSKAISDLKAQQAELNKVKEGENEIAVRRKMGILYYIFPCGRDVERKRQARIAAISSEMEKQMDLEKMGDSMD